MIGSATKILITSQKGGVGKSTIAANLAAYLNDCDQRRTVLLDFDHQSTSSKWVRGAAKSDLGVENHSRSTPQPPGTMALQAAGAVRRAAVRHQVVVADLTWHDLLPTEFLFDFDFVLVPCSMSHIEMDSTLEFVSRLSHVFRSQRRTPPKLVIVPSAIRNLSDYHALMSRYFDFDFFLSPPVIHSENAQEAFCNRFLFSETQTAVRDNFVEFSRSVALLIDQHERQEKKNIYTVSTTTRTTPRGDSEVLDQFMRDRGKTAPKQQRVAAFSKLTSLMEIPRYLRAGDKRVTNAR